MNLRMLEKNVFVNKQITVDWIKTQGLIPREKECIKCGNGMLHNVNRSGYVAGSWKCTKRTQHRDGKDYEIAASNKTWFSGCKMGLVKPLCLMYGWAQK
jgi:hypothetical protein